MQKHSFEIKSDNTFYVAVFRWINQNQTKLNLIITWKERNNNNVHKVLTILLIYDNSKFAEDVYKRQILDSITIPHFFWMAGSVVKFEKLSCSNRKYALRTFYCREYKKPAHCKGAGLKKGMKSLSVLIRSVRLFTQADDMEYPLCDQYVCISVAQIISEYNQ